MINNEKIKEFGLVRCDPYLFFSSKLVKDNANMVEIGTRSGQHIINLCQMFHGKIIAYEAGRQNYIDLMTAIKGLPAIAHNCAVTGKDGEVSFFEFAERSSNSIYPRHINEGRRLNEEVVIRSISVENILKENDIDYIDVLFSNCEGAELNILHEVLCKPSLREKIGQLCISFHGNKIYPKQKEVDLVEKMSEFYVVIEDITAFPCHLFIRKDLYNENK